MTSVTNDKFSYLGVPNSWPISPPSSTPNLLPLPSTGVNTKITTARRFSHSSPLLTPRSIPPITRNHSSCIHPNPAKLPDLHPVSPLLVSVVSAPLLALQTKLPVIFDAAKTRDALIGVKYNSLSIANLTTSLLADESLLADHESRLGSLESAMVISTGLDVAQFGVMGLQAAWGAFDKMRLGYNPLDDSAEFETGDWDGDNKQMNLSPFTLAPAGLWFSGLPNEISRMEGKVGLNNTLPSFEFDMRGEIRQASSTANETPAVVLGQKQDELLADVGLPALEIKTTGQTVIQDLSAPVVSRLQTRRHLPPSMSRITKPSDSPIHPVFIQSSKPKENELRLDAQEALTTQRARFMKSPLLPSPQAKPISREPCHSFVDWGRVKKIAIDQAVGGVDISSYASRSWVSGRKTGLSVPRSNSKHLNNRVPLTMPIQATKPKTEVKTSFLQIQSTKPKTEVTTFLPTRSTKPKMDTKTSFLPDLGLSKKNEKRIVDIEADYLSTVDLSPYLQKTDTADVQLTGDISLSGSLSIGSITLSKSSGQYSSLTLSGSGTRSGAWGGYNFSNGAAFLAHTSTNDECGLYGENGSAWFIHCYPPGTDSAYVALNYGNSLKLQTRSYGINVIDSVALSGLKSISKNATTLELNADLGFTTGVKSFGAFEATGAVTFGGSITATGNFLTMNGKETIDAVDTWLRLNQNSDFTNGVYTPGLLRADGGMEVRNSPIKSTLDGQCLQCTGTAMTDNTGLWVSNAGSYIGLRAGDNWGVLCYNKTGTGSNYATYLRHNNSTKFQTTGLGVKVTGAIYGYGLYNIYVGTNTINFYNDYNYYFGVGWERWGANNRYEMEVGPAGAGHVYADDFHNVSDERRKKNIRSVGNQWEKAKRLQFREYEMNDADGKVRCGVIAQEVEMIFPECVSEGSEENGCIKTVSYNMVFSRCLAGVLEKLKEIDERLISIEKKYGI